MKKAYFQYYETFENVLEKIKDIEEREHMRKTIINYGLYGTLPAGLSELEEMAWTICKDLIDQQTHRREVNAANRAGKKADPEIIWERDELRKHGAEPEENTPAEMTEGEIENIKLEAANGMTAAQIARTHNRTVTEIKKHLPKADKFKKPTVEEIAAFCKEKNININVNKFFLYYESNGWYVGKSHMKSWKAAVQRWAENNYDNNKATGTIWENNSTDAVPADIADLF